MITLFGRQPPSPGRPLPLHHLLLWRDDGLSLAILEFLLLLGVIALVGHHIALLLLRLKALADLVDLPLPLHLAELRMLLHEVDARASPLYKRISNQVLLEW